MNLLQGLPLVYTRPELELELRQADWRLQVVVGVAAAAAAELDCALTVTSVARLLEDTQRIYREAGLEPPKRPGVHDVIPTRGADAVPVTALHCRYSIAELGPMLEHRLNQLIEYPRGYQAALWHDVQGAHLHLQVPWDGLALLPDPLPIRGS